MLIPRIAGCIGRGRLSWLAFSPIPTIVKSAPHWLHVREDMTKQSADDAFKVQCK